MGVPDCQIDEDDYEWCEDHKCYKPCVLCRIEAAEYRGECEREERT